MADSTLKKMRIPPAKTVSEYHVTGLPICRKILFFLEEDFSGMEERKRSRSRDRKKNSPAKKTLWVAEKRFCIDKRAYLSLVLTLYWHIQGQSMRAIIYSVFSTIYYPPISLKE